jgi:hypothetical protein
MCMVYDSITHNMNGYIVHHQMLALKILRTWSLAHGIAIQMLADHGDSTVVLAHSCLLF